LHDHGEETPSRGGGSGRVLYEAALARANALSLILVAFLQRLAVAAACFLARCSPAVMMGYFAGLFSDAHVSIH
jgi:hypothetical protein